MSDHSVGTPSLRESLSVLLEALAGDMRTLARTAAAFEAMMRSPDGVDPLDVLSGDEREVMRLARWAILRSLLMDVGRLCGDRAKTGGAENLTLERVATLLRRAPGPVARSAVDLADEAHDKWRNSDMKKVRDKLNAHNDLEVALGVRKVPNYLVDELLAMIDMILCCFVRAESVASGEKPDRQTGEGWAWPVADRMRTYNATMRVIQSSISEG